jgi:hypothetical protein
MQKFLVNSYFIQQSEKSKYSLQYFLLLIFIIISLKIPSSPQIQFDHFSPSSSFTDDIIELAGSNDLTREIFLSLN